MKLNGKWNIVRIVLSDTAVVVPAKETPDCNQSITFNTDGSYYVLTNCNTICGGYTLSGDSLKLNDGIMTEMACDNMAVEDAMRQIIPFVTTVSFNGRNDARLSTADSKAYIEIHLATHPTH